MPKVTLTSLVTGAIKSGEVTLKDDVVERPITTIVRKDVFDEFSDACRINGWTIKAAIGAIMALVAADAKSEAENAKGDSLN